MLVIIIFSPRPHQTGVWNVKARLGIAAYTGLSVEKLIKSIDANFGGRWNAGSNKRGGGSAIPPKEYAEAIMTNLCAHSK